MSARFIDVIFRKKIFIRAADIFATKLAAAS